MRVGILRLFLGECGTVGMYNVQELGLAKALAGRGIETYVFLLRSHKDLKQVKIDKICEKVKVVYIPAWGVGSHGSFDCNVIRDFDLTVLHVVSDIQLFTSRIIKWCKVNNLNVISYIGTVNSSSKNILKRLFAKCVFKYNGKYLKQVLNIAKTPYVYEKLIQNGIVNSRMIPVGLDKTLLNENIQISKQSLKKEFDIPKNSKVLLFIGRLEENKNPLFALGLLEYLLRYDDSYFLIMIGKGNQKDEILSFIKSRNLINNIRFIEKIFNKDIWKIYSAGDVYLNLCKTEIFGMCIMESMFYRCPVVAIDAAGPRYIIENGTYGYIAEELSFNRFKYLIEKAIQNREEVTLLAYDRIRKVLCWDSIVNNYIQIYKEMKL